MLAEKVGRRRLAEEIGLHFILHQPTNFEQLRVYTPWLLNQIRVQKVVSIHNTTPGKWLPLFLLLFLQCVLFFLSPSVSAWVTPIELWPKISDTPYKILFELPAYPLAFKQPPLPVMMFNEEENQPPSVVPAELMIFMYAAAEKSEYGDYDKLTDFLLDHPVLAQALATFPEVTEDASGSSPDNTMLLKILRRLYQNHELTNQILNTISKLIQDPVKQKKCLIDLLTGNRVMIRLIVMNVFDNDLKATLTLLIEHPDLITVMNSDQYTRQEVGQMLSWISKNRKIVRDFFNKVDITHVDQGNLLRDIFRYKPLASGLLVLGAGNIQTLFEFLEQVHPGQYQGMSSTPLEWLIDLQQAISMNPIQLANILDSATVLLQNSARPLDRAYFLLTLLRRLRAVDAPPFSSPNDVSSRYQLLLVLLEAVTLNGIGPIANIQEEEERSGLCLLLLTLLMTHQHLWPVIFQRPQAIAQNNYSNLFSSLQLLGETNITPILAQIVAHPEHLAAINRQVDHPKNLKALIEVADNDEKFAQLLSRMNEISVQPELLLPGRPSSPPPPYQAHWQIIPLPFLAPLPPTTGRLPAPACLLPLQALNPSPYSAGEFMTLLGLIRNNSPSLHLALSKYPPLMEGLTLMYSAQCQIGWLNIVVLILAGNLLQKDWDFSNPMSSAHFLLTLFNEANKNGVFPFYHSDSDSRFPKLQTLLQHQLALMVPQCVATEDMETLAHVVLVTLMQSPCAVSQIMHPGMSVTDIPPVSLLTQLELLSSEGHQHAVSHLLQLLLTHTGWVIPLNMLAEKSPEQLLDIILLTQQVTPDLLQNATHWQLQVLTLSLSAVILLPEGIDSPTSIPPALTSFLQEFLSTHLPFANNHIAAIAILLIRKIPELANQTTAEGIQQLLNEELAGKPLSPFDLR